MEFTEEELVEFGWVRPQLDVFKHNVGDIVNLSI